METQSRKIILGLPKGSLQEATFGMMKMAGFEVMAGSRSYRPEVNDDEIDTRLIRAQEISRYVEHGMLDAGITGYDWVVENNSDVVEVADLVYAKQGRRPVRWVVAVANDSPYRTINDLQGKRIATEAVGLTRRYLEKHGLTADVEFSWGATEVKVPELVDAIVELTETGSSLRAHNLRVIDTVMESTTKFIANKTAWTHPGKRKKMEQITMMLKAVLDAECRELIKLNVAKENLEKVIGLMPAMRAPTTHQLSTDEEWYSIESVVEKTCFRELLPKLKEAGAEGILEISLNKVIL